MDKAGLKDLALWALRLRRCYKVEGESMEPLLKSGDRVFAKKEKTYEVGDIVVSRHPYKKSIKLVKKIQKVADGRVSLIGLNQEASTDSRVFSSVPVSHILGKAISCLKS